MIIFGVIWAIIMQYHLKFLFEDIWLRRKSLFLKQQNKLLSEKKFGCQNNKAKCFGNKMFSKMNLWYKKTSQSFFWKEYFAYIME